MERVVARGRWLYDSSTAMLVRVIETDYDFWYGVGEADGVLEENESPQLNEQGRAYYLKYKPNWEPGQPFWPDSVDYMSLDQAKAAAEEMLPSAVSWSYRRRDARPASAA